MDMINGKNLKNRVTSRLMPEPIVIKMASTEDLFTKKKQQVPNITQGGMMDIKLRRLESIEFILPVFYLTVL